MAKNKIVGVACDHAGFALKKFVLQYLEEKGYPYKDYGTWSDASVDYPDFGHAVTAHVTTRTLHILWQRILSQELYHVVLASVVQVKEWRLLSTSIMEYVQDWRGMLK